MSTVAAVGNHHGLEGFALSGVLILTATTPDAVLDAWASLDPDVGLVILTPEAADNLGPRLVARPDIMWVVMP